MAPSAVAAPVDHSARLARLEALATLLDSRWRIPGIGVRIGIDGIASILPVIGDSATGVVSAYLILEAARAGAPRHLLVRMAGNAGLDWLVGSIPVLGTLFDIGFKANNRNVAMLRRHLEASRTL
ncbi:DUF4112 domain-containing protein [Geminicoccaceae bacterium 1502E]|nr:DUF4112 domain-containing protein [Geminicoccaceae bacterium 1502E]